MSDISVNQLISSLEGLGVSELETKIYLALFTAGIVGLLVKSS